MDLLRISRRLRLLKCPEIKGCFLFHGQAMENGDPSGPVVHESDLGRDHVPGLDVKKNGRPGKLQTLRGKDGDLFCTKTRNRKKEEKKQE